MGLLFVLIFWAILFCIISLALGLLGIIAALLYSHYKKVKVRFLTWFIAPGILLFGFAGINFAVSVFLWYYNEFRHRNRRLCKRKHQQEISSLLDRRARLEN